MKRSAVCVHAVAVLFAMTVAAQEEVLDPNVAADVLRQSGTDLGATVRGNQQLLQEYHRAAIEQALAEEAVRRGLAERTSVQNELQRLRRMTLVAALRDDIIRATPAPTPSEFAAAYSNDMGRWAIPFSYLLDALEVATNSPSAIAEAKAAIVTLPLVKTNRADYLQTLRAKGIGIAAFQQYYPTNRIELPLLREIEGMKDGDVRSIERPDGSMVVRVTGRRPPTFTTFDDAKTALEPELRRAKAERFWQAFIQQKREELGLDRPPQTGPAPVLPPAQ